MWHLFFNLLLVSLGAGIGVALMCLLVVGKETDRSMENLERGEKK